MSHSMVTRPVRLLLLLLAIASNRPLSAQEDNKGDVERQVESQLELLERLESDSPCVNALLVAVKDQSVRDLLITKATDQCFLLRDVCCLQIPRIPEYEFVLFDFDCAPHCFCLVDPQFLVTVDRVNNKVIDIRDPYLGPTKPCRSLRTATESFNESTKAPASHRDSDAAAVEIAIASRNYEFELNGEINPPITVKKGSQVRVTLTSDGGTHDWTMSEVAGENEKILARTCAVSSQSAEPVAIEFTACTLGEHVYYCSLGSHRRRGMEGRFIVVE